MPIKGLSNIRRMPRLGVIKLGKKNEANGAPMALDYFLCPGEVREVYGEKPIVLDIRFPMERADDIFPQFYKLYGSSAGLKAYSDGEKIWTRGNNPGEWIESIASSKEELQKQGFRGTATLNFVLPKVSFAGTYQINTRSFHSIVQLNTSIEYIQKLFGKIQGLPLKLKLDPVDAHIQINGKPAKKVVYVMKLVFENAEIMEYLQKRRESMDKLVNNQAPMLAAPEADLAEAEADIEEDDDDEEELDGPDEVDEDLGGGISRKDLPK